MNLEVFLNYFDKHFSVYLPCFIIKHPAYQHLTVFIFKIPTLPPSHLKHKDERKRHFSCRSCKFSLSQNCNKYTTSPAYSSSKASECHFFTSSRVEEEILYFFLRRVKAAATRKYAVRETEGNFGKRKKEIQYSRWDITEKAKRKAATNGIRYRRR